MSKVLYDNYKLEPSPVLSIQKSYRKSGDGATIGSVYSITLNFTISCDHGSPRSKIDTSLSPTGWAGPSNAFWTLSGYAPVETISEPNRLAAIQRKQE